MNTNNYFPERKRETKTECDCQKDFCNSLEHCEWKKTLMFHRKRRESTRDTLLNYIYDN
jgi:hypothetical protein